MPPKSDKPAVKRETLNRNRIWFESDRPFDYAIAPAYLQTFYDIVLDFHGVVQIESEDNGEILYRVSKRDTRWYNPERPSPYNEIINQAKAISAQAKELAKRRVAEKKWDELFYVSFLKPLHDAWKPGEQDARAIARQKYFYDQFECDGDKLWTLFNTNFRREDRVGLTAPKPDRFFAFPIRLTTNRFDELSELDRWRWPGSKRLVENFSLDVLDNLWDEGNGLWCCPFRSQEKSSQSKRRQSKFEADRYRPRDLQCFPWLIVEHKEGAEDRSKRAKAEAFCYCQAANASSAALMLLQSASEYAEEGPDGQCVPPIPVITTIGEKVRIWIAWHWSARDNSSADEESDEESDEDYFDDDDYANSEGDFSVGKKINCLSGSEDNYVSEVQPILTP
ncbi:hypothetical protein HJFPF1_10881 [Paramyrothecium foliicola]|nr:hypothetical protein HJFPF1_10881 [Paramyrothecium foliicola]